MSFYRGDRGCLAHEEHEANQMRAAPRRAIIILLWLVAAAVSAESAAKFDELLDELRPFEGRPVSAIELDGNRVTRPYIIYRELETAVGQPLRLTALLADLQRLHNLDIFSSVRLRARIDGDAVALTIQMREIPYAIPYISYDVTDQDGWSFGPALKSVNMMGRDVFVAGYALFGGTTTYLLDFTAPWIAANHLSVELDLNRIERDNVLDEFGETAFEFTPRVGSYIGNAGRASLLFSYMQIESDEPGHTLSLSNRDQLVRLGGSLGFDTRDSWGDPHRGWLNEIELIRTGGPLQGEGDFWTSHLDLRRFQPLGNQTVAVAGLLSLQSSKGGSTLPEYEDYHLGGSNSIRGYRVGELGRSLHGRNQLLLTAEYRGQLIPSREYVILGLAGDLGLSWALFADSGIAWNEAEEFDGSRFKTGVGLGLRVLMPAVDMTRLDIGVGEEGDLVFHFAVFSKMSAQRFRRR